MQLDLFFVGVPVPAQSDWLLCAQKAGLQCRFFEHLDAIRGDDFVGVDVALTPFETAAEFQDFRREYRRRGGGPLSVAILERADYAQSGAAFRAGAEDVIAMPLGQADCMAMFEHLRGIAAKTIHPDAILPLEIVERHAIHAALLAHNGQVSKTARKLGIGRSTLYRKLEQYGLMVGS